MISRPYKNPPAVLVVPTFNEACNIEPLLDAVLKLELPMDILVVDDNSPDATGSIVQDYSKRRPHVRLFARPYREGLGRAYAEAFRKVLKEGYRYILQMDADFSHDPEMLPRMLKALRTKDVVVGSRYIRGGSTENWAFHRFALSRLATWFTRAVLGGFYTDATSGFKGFRREVLESLDLAKVEALGYVFQIEINHLARRNGFRFLEIPIHFVDRVRGNSKLNFGVLWEAFRLVLGLRFPTLRRLPNVRPQRRHYGSQRGSQHSRGDAIRATPAAPNRADHGNHCGGRWLQRRDRRHCTPVGPA